MANEAAPKWPEERVNATVRDLAAFEVGDRVTVEPQGEDIPYLGKAFEGVPLVVDRVVVTNDDVTPVDAVDDPDEDRIVDDFYVETIRYEFDTEFTTTPLSEDLLIPWDDHDGRIHLRPHGDRYRYITEGSECPVCGRTAVEVDGKRLTVDHTQTRSCAVCGYDKGTEAT
jgi:hypothetical protein